MRVTINGKPVDLPGAISVNEVLERLAIPLRGVAVELDGRLLERRDFGETRVEDGAVLEIVRPIGGG